MRGGWSGIDARTAESKRPDRTGEKAGENTMSYPRFPAADGLSKYAGAERSKEEWYYSNCECALL
jgi:hypothetical protein